MSPFQQKDVSRQLQKETDAAGLMGDDSVTDAAAATAAAVGALTAANPAGVTAASVAALAGAALVVTWTSNDPGGTPNGIITIADGSAALVIAEVMEFLEEVEGGFADLSADDVLIVAEVDKLVIDHALSRAEIVKLVTDGAEERTAIDALIVDVADIRTQLNLAITALEAAGVLS